MLRSLLNAPLLRRLLFVLLLASPGGCMVNPVPTPEKSSTSLDTPTSDTQGGTTAGEDDSAKTSGTDAAAAGDFAGDASSADVAADTTATAPVDTGPVGDSP